MPKDLGAIRRLIGPRKRHLSLSVEAAKEIKQRPIDGDFEPLLDETRENRDQLHQHLTVYKDLRKDLEDAAKKAGKMEHETVMADYDECMELVFEAEHLVVGLSSKIEMIKDRFEFVLKRGTLKVNHNLDEKMLEIERQKAEIEQRKLEIEAERLNLEKVKLEKKLEAETAKTHVESCHEVEEEWHCSGVLFESGMSACAHEGLTAATAFTSFRF
ncbi:hypothetical protein OS493_034941 [Desmophyllum pertusum]|uniref:Uncharacterized protein n=1 Tax=Desmophyllum pertusum TaxID=174260 RepID=A0A9W9YV20_9CNID|nr:hypothetical protein OS493_034941 [Desmophyllum pertusum]